MKRAVVCALVAAVVGGVLLPVSGRPEPPPAPLALPAILTRDAAYLPGPPQMIAPARGDAIVPHPEGRYALIAQRDEALPPGPQIGKAETGGSSLVLWDGLARRARIVWQHVAVPQVKSSSGIGDIKWMAGTQNALAYTITSERDPVTGKTIDLWSLLFIDPLRDGRARVLRAGNQPTGFSLSPTLPFAVITQRAFTEETAALRSDSEVTYHILNARGQIGPALDLPRDSYLFGWSKDGGTTYALWREKQEKRPLSEENTPTPPTVLHWFAVDVRSGVVRPLSEKPKEREALRRFQEPLKTAATAELRLTQSKAVYAGPEGAPAAEPLRPLFLQSAVLPSPTPSLFLAPHADESYLLADNSAVLYTSQRAVYLIPLVKLARNEYALVQREAYRNRAVSNAKQVGLAILGYLQDHDERFPPSGDVAALVAEYVKNAAIFQDPSTGKSGFTYLLNGDPQAKMDNVSITRVGYLTGPGGHAVLFADGHVKWEDNP